MTLFIKYIIAICLETSRSRIKIVLRSLRFVPPTLRGAFLRFP